MEYLEVVRQGHFPKLWASQILSLLAQSLLNFALIIRVFDLAQGTHFANASVSLIILSFGVPSVLFASVAGIYVDHWDRRRVMIISNLMRAIFVLGFLVLESNLVAMLIIAFFISTTTQFFAPAEAAAIPIIVDHKRLIAANSLFILTFYATFIVGYSAAAPVLGTIGAAHTYLAVALMFFVATAMALWLPKMPAQGKPIKLRLSSLYHNTKSELSKNLRMITSDHNLYFPITQLTVVQGLLSVVLALAPALSLAVLKAPLQRTSQVLVIPAGMGMVFGVLIVSRLTKRYAKLSIISIALVAAGASLTFIGLTGQLYRTIGGSPIASLRQVTFIVAALLLILGLMNAMISVTSQTVLQESSTNETRGRIYGALYTMINGAATTPDFISGILADLFSVTKVLTVAGLIVLVFAVSQLLYIRRTSFRT